MSISRLRIAVTVLIACCVLVPAAAGDVYPTPLPPFPNPGMSRPQYFDRIGGTTERPLLVVYTHFSDVADPPGQGLAWADGRYFGDSFPSAVHYFEVNSSGALGLSRAAETQGTPDDGIVDVNAGASGPFLNPPGVPLDPEGLQRRNKTSLQLADPYVDYSSFDRNDNGHITVDELAIVNLYVDPTGGSDDCGVARGIEDVTLDGVQFDVDAAHLSTSTNLMTNIHELGHLLFNMRDYYGFGVGNFDIGAPTCDGEGTFMAASAYHKLHLGWAQPTIVTRDGYYDVPNAYTTGRSFLLYDPERGTNDYFLVENRRQQADTYEASAQDSGLVIWRIDDTQYNSDSELIRPVELMRPGAISARGCSTTFARAASPIVEGNAVEWTPGSTTANPTVATASANSATPAGRALRTSATGEEVPIATFWTWSMTAEGSIAVGDDVVTGNAGRVKAAGTPAVGTVIGTAASAASDGEPVQIQLTLSRGLCSGGTSVDAWDPSDPQTPDRTMIRAWRDGTPSRLAVRAIGPSAETIRAYFDVRGPGVLVDCYERPGVAQPISPGIENTLGVPVTNTGEGPDTFSVSAINLPLGWSSRPQTTALEPGRSVLAHVLVTPSADAAPGTYVVTVAAESTTEASVRSDCVYDVRVVLTPTQLEYTGSTRVPTGEPAGFRAVLTEAGGPWPVAGSQVTFRVSGSGGTFVATATTDAAGIAAANPTMPLRPGTYDLLVTAARNARWAGAGVRLQYVVEPRPTVLAYTGVTAAQWSDPASVSAQLTDGITGAPLPGKLVTLSIGGQAITLTTGPDGTVAGAITLEQAAGAYLAAASFGAETYYRGSVDIARFDIGREFIVRWRYAGDTVAALGAPVTVAAVADQQADGYPGELALAQAELRLSPLLGGTPFVETTDIDTTGLASRTFTDLAPNLYSLSLAVPASNAFWEGSADDVAEFAVFDPNRGVAGSVSGAASSGRVAVTVDAEYANGLPVGRIRLSTPTETFAGTRLDWVVVAGSKAVLRVHGSYGTEPAALRLWLSDGGSSSDPDTFRADVAAELTGRLLYTSGDVTVTTGNVVLR
jgi:M6 family metalloprotease-like protein